MMQNPFSSPLPSAVRLVRNLCTYYQKPCLPSKALLVGIRYRLWDGIYLSLPEEDRFFQEELWSIDIDSVYTKEGLRIMYTRERGMLFFFDKSTLANAFTSGQDAEEIRKNLIKLQTDPMIKRELISYAMIAMG